LYKTTTRGVINFYKKQQEDIKIILIFRSLSIFITSFFYAFGSPDHSLGQKTFIIICILIASLILQYLYVKNWGSTPSIIFLVLLEVTGNTILLIPSGGIASPYLWYSLNTILISSIRLNQILCWINFAVYLSTSMGILYLGTYPSLELLPYIYNHERNFILSLILITIAMQILARYMKKLGREKEKLRDVNKELQWSNTKIKATMDHTMELYQMVDMLSAERDGAGLISLIIDSTRKITKAKDVIFYSPKFQTSPIVDGDVRKEIEDQIKFKILERWSNFIETTYPIEIRVNEQVFILTPIKSNALPYGILGIGSINYEGKDGAYSSYAEQMNFLSKLSAIVLERVELEQVNRGLIINEEQNRIADEIHDSVLQQLFSASCGLFALIKSKKTDKKQLEEDLNTIRSAINRAMKDLRSVIYGMSWKKNGTNNFELDLRDHIHEVKSLNKVDIHLDIEGKHELLTNTQKMALYRIICEGIGNGLRHGKAKAINITLGIDLDLITLTIRDNGRGFDYKRFMNSKQGGLGIKNMNYLVQSLQGDLQFYSEAGKGTEIIITLPNQNHHIKEEII